MRNPWTTEEAAYRFILNKATETWDQLFDEPANLDNEDRFFENLERRSGNKFTIVPVIPPCEQPEAEDAFELNIISISKFCIQKQLEFGWYISNGGGTYLRKDGTTGGTTVDKSGTYAYWRVKQEAKDFLKEWEKTT